MDSPSCSAAHRVAPARIPAFGGKCLGWATTPQRIPQCLALGICVAPSAPPAIRFSALRNNRLASPLVDCWSERRDVPRALPASLSLHRRTSSNSSSIAVILRRCGGWTPPYGFVPLDAPPAWTADRATRLGVGCARRAERPAGVRCRSHRVDAAWAACDPLGLR